MTDQQDGASLQDRAQQFAEEIEATLLAVLPGKHAMLSRRIEDFERYVLRPAGPRGEIPIHVGGEHLASLAISFYLTMDRAKAYLKTVGSKFTLLSVLEKKPLVRLEYLADMQRAPISHWQMHAERGAFSHLLARAHAHNPERVAKPHDLASLHLPVGGERYRPCLEDLLEFLVVDCGVDHQPGWQNAVHDGRMRWRRRQLGAAVRDTPDEAARVLRELGWRCTEPGGVKNENLKPLITW